MQRIVAFDFDETITTRDSLPLLLKYSFGNLSWWWGVLCCLPWILLYKLGLCEGGDAKERLLSHFIKGMSHDEFVQCCRAFAARYRNIHSRPEVVSALKKSLDNGDKVLVVTASAKEWVEPWIADSRVSIISTELEVDSDGLMTGRLSTPNCNGPEKWHRIVEAVPDAAKGIDIAYGDSCGDREMLSHAYSTYYRDFSTPVEDKKWCERNGTTLFWIVMAVLVLYQLSGVFFGMDLADAGFYLTFYDNIFTHPESVQYNFMYYLSGVTGGTFQLLFPSMGIAGMRLIGVLFNTLCGVLLYVALKRHVPAWVIALGCTLIVTSYIQPVYTLSYDLCTILLYVLVAIFLWRGVVRHRFVPIAIAGLLAGLNIFMRLPNVLGLSLMIIPLLKTLLDVNGRVLSAGWGRAVREVFIFMIGAGLGVYVVLMFMPDRHLSAFLAVLNDLNSIASDTSGTTSHTVGQLIMTQLRFYGVELWTAVKLAVPVIAYWAARRWLDDKRWLSCAVKIAAVALWVWFVSRMHPLQPVWLMCLVGCVIVIVKNKGNNISLIGLIGVIIMLLMPLGSDGAYNNGTIIAWVASPVAALWWSHRTRIAFPLALIAVCAVRMVTGGAYFDGGSLLEKNCTVNAGRAACIYTTADRALALNVMLNGIEPYVNPGDTLLAYGSIPTINYLTHTQPYMGCSWPEQLSAGMLQRKLEESSQCGMLPHVLRQKFNTLGQEWSAASDSYLTDYGTRNTYQDNRKLQVLNDFLQANHYEELYSDSCFVLLAPKADTDTVSREDKEKAYYLMNLGSQIKRPR